MPRYFFDLADHENTSDLDGTELVNDDAARAQAVTFAGSYLRDHPELVFGTGTRSGCTSSARRVRRCSSSWC